MKIAAKSKRFTHGLMAFVLMTGTIASGAILTQPASAFSGGAGTSGSPYTISTCTDLMEIDDSPENLAAHYSLTTSLNCSANGNSAMISEFDEGDGAWSQFSGTFNGNNHTVTINVSVGEDWKVGLFRHIDGGTVKDLTVAGTITEALSLEVGGLVGLAENATLQNVHSSVAIDATYPDNDSYSIGGLVGRMMGNTSISDSHASGNINLGDFSQASKIGGFVGQANGGTIVRSSASGNITGSGWQPNEIGGFVGTLDGGGKIDESISRGDVTPGSGAQYIGGFAGYITGEMQGTFVSNSYTRSYVAAPGGYGGSFAGWIGEEGELADDGLNKVYSANEFLGTEAQYYGLAPDAWNTVYNSFWDSETFPADQWDASALPRTTAQMKDIANYTTLGDGVTSAWDFVGTENDDSGTADIWGITTGYNDGYPCLTWEADCDGSENENGSDTDGEPANIKTFANSVTGANTMVELGSNCAITDASALTNPAVKDAGYTYKSGLVQFDATCSGGATEVKVYQFGVDAKGLVLRKHNPATGAYFTITGATVTNEVIDGKQAAVATYTIVDDGDLDLDKRPGYISDPVGLGSLMVGSPNTGIKRIR